MSDAPRRFRIQSDHGVRDDDGRCRSIHYDSIPWWLAEIAYKEYSRRFGTDQSLERLAQRGGFGKDELLMFLSGPKPKGREN